MPPWLHPAGPITLTALALLLLTWSLFANRHRGRIRCPKCWYDLSAHRKQPTQERTQPLPLPLLPITCPECAKRITKPKQLQRTRRRYRPAAFALFLLTVAYALHLTPIVQKRGYAAAIPALLLIPFDSPRMDAHGLMDTSNWASTELQRRWDNAELNRLDVVVLKWKTRPRLLLGRKHWPRGVTPQFEFYPLRLGTPGMVQHVTVKPDDTLRVSVWKGLPEEALSMFNQSGIKQFELLRTMPDLGIVEFNVAVAQSQSNRDTPVEQFTLRYPLLVSGSIEDLIRPLEDPQLQREIAERIEARFAFEPNEQVLDRVLMFRIPQNLDDIGVALHITLLHNDNEVWSNTPICVSRSRMRTRPNILRFAGTGSLSVSPDFDPAEWTVRITGDAEASLSDFRAKRYWNAVIELPLEDLLKGDAHLNALARDGSASLFSSLHPILMPDLLNDHPEYLTFHKPE